MVFKWRGQLFFSFKPESQKLERMQRGRLEDIVAGQLNAGQ